MTAAVYCPGKHCYLVLLLQGPSSHPWGRASPSVKSILIPQEALCDSNKRTQAISLDVLQTKRERVGGYVQLGMNQLKGQKVKHGFVYRWSPHALNFKITA